MAPALVSVTGMGTDGNTARLIVSTQTTQMTRVEINTSVPGQPVTGSS